MAQEFKSLQTTDYYKKFYDEDIRPDNRKLNELRFTAINVGSISTADGSSLVRLGNTSVMCGIKAELATPKVNEPCKGFIVPNVELSPLCAAHFKPGPPGEQAQITSQQVVEIIESTRLIDLQQLCIKEGKIAWVLYCDILCLNYDGSLLDASLMALICALKSLKLPSVEVDPENDTPKVSYTTMRNIEFFCIPTSTTFAMFESKLLIDPTCEEEFLSAGLITVTVTENGICGLYKAGGPAVEDEQLQQCIIQAEDRRNVVVKLINSALASAT
ncbi:Exosome complex component RRP43 [Chamberlinius hualienensis]